jgi:membrane protein
VEGRAQRLAERARAERQRHRSLDAVFDMVDRDGEVAGGIIAGALAYRLFLWLLPLALVAVAGLGIAADAADRSPESAATSAGLGGLVSDSIAGAAKSSNRWYALLVGIPVLVYVTRSVLRGLIAAHRLVWADVRAAAPRATVVGTLRLLVLLFCLFVLGGLSSAVREWSETIGLLWMVAIGLAYAGVWLLVSLRLPHRGAPTSALIPGALLFGLGVQLIHVFSVYFLEPWALSKQGTYGALGIAAALLLGLFVFCRLIVAAAVLNATLWQRRGGEGAN